MTSTASRVAIAFLSISCGGPEAIPGARTASADLTSATPVSPAQGQILSNARVTFSGRSDAAAGTAVTVAALDARLLQRSCKAAVGKDQTWSCAIQLAEGGYTWTAQAGHAGAVSSQFDFVVSIGKLPAPLIDHTASPTADAKPILTGVASAKLVSADAKVIVSEGGTTLCTAALKSASWSCALAAVLPDGRHLLAAVVETRNDDDDDDDDYRWNHDDDDGGALVRTASSNPDLFVVKTGIGKPTVNPIPSPTDLTTIQFSGTGEPSASVTVAEGGALLCRAAVATSGAWTCAVDALRDGTHDAQVSQADAAGNTSGAVGVSFVIDTHLPSAPTLDTVATPTSNPAISLSGTGEPAARVSVLDSYSNLLCTAAVGSTGTWKCATELSDGDYLMTAFQATAVGKRSGPSNAVPLSVRTLVAPLFDPIASPTRNPQPTLGGTAAALAMVAVHLGEETVCSGRADAGGRWSCVPAAPFADGSYLLLAQVEDARGHVSPVSQSRALVVDTTPPAAPVLDAIAGTKHAAKAVVSGSAEPASAVAVTNADTSALLCTAAASAAGTFRCTPGSGLAAGIRVTATATDAAGNTSSPAPAGSYSDSAVTLRPPTIESPADAAEVEQRRPAIKGHTDPGTIVEVTLDGDRYMAQVDVQGAWTLMPPADLQTGTHAIAAAALDTEQNQSDVAESSFKVIEGGFARGGCSTGGVPGPLALLALALAWPRRRRALLLVVMLAAVPAWADMDVALFTPASAGDGFAAVEGARPPLPGEGRLEVRTWVGYAVHPLTRQRDSGATEPLVRGVASGWLGAQIHLVGPLSLAAQVPMIFSQDGNLSSLPPSSRGPSSLSGGFADLRLTPRLSLLREEGSGIDLAAQASLDLPTGAAQSLASDGRVRGEVLLAAGKTLGTVWNGAFTMLANAYFRLRPPRELADVRSGNEAGARAGLGYRLATPRAFYVPARVYTELEARTFLRSGFAAGSTPAEWRLGTTLCPVRSLAVDAAFGTALSDGIGAPRARFLLGFSWSPSACETRDVPQRLAQVTTVAPAPVLAVPARAVEPQPIA